MASLEKRISAIERKLYSVLDGVKVRSLNEKILLNGTDVMYVVSLEGGNHVSRKVVINSIKTFVLTGYQTPDDISAAIQNIVTNTQNIQTNVTAIQNNAGNISNNDDDIAINSQAIQVNKDGLTNIHDNIGGLGVIVVNNSNNITNLQSAQLQILNRLQDVEFLAAANTQLISTNTAKIEKDRVVSLNASFVNAGVDYTANYGVSGGVVHLDDGSILQTDKDCLIHYNIGSLDCTVYVNKSKQLYTDIEAGKTSVITMFNSDDIGVPAGQNPVFTRLIKELNFQAKIEKSTYQDSSINGVEYRLYGSAIYNFSSEINSNDVVVSNAFVKATHDNII